MAAIWMAVLGTCLGGRKSSSLPFCLVCVAHSVTHDAITFMRLPLVPPLLHASGQDEAIARSAGRFTLALAPALVMDGLDQCCRRYLSAQAVVQPLMLVTLFATLLTPLFLHVFVFK